MAEYERIIHPFPPLYGGSSEILILGSLPSVKSREEGFFYGHPRNRFWPLMAALLKEPAPETVEEKKTLILENGLALWDVILSCDIKGSGDSSIKNVVPTDLGPVIAGSEIRLIICNGKAAGRYYERYQEKKTGIRAVVLPSTSPANAAWSMEQLSREWGKYIGAGKQ